MLKKNSNIINGTSLQGFAHIDDDIPCQDAHAFLEKDDYYYLAIADGAGSAKLSHISSNYIVKEIIKKLSNSNISLTDNLEKLKFIFESLVNELVDNLLNDYLKEEEIDKISKRDFHTTLIVAIGNNEKGIIFHVGDGTAIVLEAQNFDNFHISKPENGEYANETFFITMKNWEEHLRITNYDNTFDSIFLMSDGVTPFATLNNCSEPSKDFLLPLLNFVKENHGKDYINIINNTLSSDKVKKISSDDKTILFLLKK